MENYKLDEIDQKIIEMLKDNGRIQWREIGDVIHMSGQAVGDRVRKLIDHQVITGFHASINHLALRSKRTDFITVIMKTTEHNKFIEMIEATNNITESYRISGHGCYLLKVESHNEEDLNHVLDEILKYANYSMNSVVKQYK